MFRASVKAGKDSVSIRRKIVGIPLLSSRGHYVEKREE